MVCNLKYVTGNVELNHRLGIRFDITGEQKRTIAIAQAKHRRAAVKVIDNLAVIDYEKCSQCCKCAEACPTGRLKVVDMVNGKV